jgi:hypothetical protein
MAMTDEQARQAEYAPENNPGVDTKGNRSPHQWRRLAQQLLILCTRKNERVTALQIRIGNLERDKKDLIQCMSVMGDALPHNKVRFARETLDNRGARGGGIFEDFQHNQIVVQFDRG